MDRIYDNPVPLADAEGVNIQDKPYDISKDWETIEVIVDSTKRQFTDDWDKTVDYAIKGRRGYLKYPHISIYDRSGDLECEPEIFYRMIDCTVDTITLNDHCTLMIMKSDVRVITGGSNCHVVLKGVNNLEEIKGLTDCYVYIEESMLEFLRISDCIRCKFEVRKGSDVSMQPLKPDSVSHRTAVNGCTSPNGTPNRFLRASFLRDNIGCYFYFSEITMELAYKDDGKNSGCCDRILVRNNTNCHFWWQYCSCILCNKFCCFSKNEDSYSTIISCTFRLNWWVICEELRHYWYSNEVNYDGNPHGLNGSECGVVHYKDLVGQDKTWALDESFLSVIESVVGGDKVILCENTRIFFNRSKVEAGKKLSAPPGEA